jgi:hypothetical protein
MESFYFEPIAKVFFCGSTSSPRTEKVNDFNLSPFTLSLSKGKLRTFAITSFVLFWSFEHWNLGFGNTLAL